MGIKSNALFKGDVKVKKIISIMLVVILVFSISACGKKKQEVDSNTSGDTQSESNSSDVLLEQDNQNFDEFQDDSLVSDLTTDFDSMLDSSLEDFLNSTTDSEYTDDLGFGDSSDYTDSGSTNDSNSSQTESSHTHKWQDATCLVPKTCSECNETQGDVTDHKYSDGKCVYCDKMENESSDVVEIEGYDSYINYRGYNPSLSDKEYSGALSNTYKKLNTKKELNVVYFGGSVTYGYGSEDSNQKGSWRVRVGNWLSSTFKNVKINNYNAAIGDTGTNLGFYRLDRDVISKKPDLLFIEFSINDYYEGISYIEASTQFESIIRKVKEALPECDIVTILVTDRTEAPLARTTKTENGDLKAGELHLQARAHEYISKKYNLPSIHVGRALADEIFKVGNGVFSADVWQQYVKDGVHPYNKGYDVYYKVIKEFLSNSLLNGGLKGCEIVKQELPKPINLQLINGDVTFIDDCDVTFTTKNGTTYLPDNEGLSDRWEEGGYKGVINFQSGSTDTVTVKFKGTELVMVVKSGLSQDNIFEVSIDGGKTWITGNYNTKNPTTLLKDLPAKEYTAIIRPAYNSDVVVDCFYSLNAQKTK